MLNKTGLSHLSRLRSALCIERELNDGGLGTGEGLNLKYSERAEENKEKQDVFRDYCTAASKLALIKFKLLSYIISITTLVTFQPMTD